MDQVLIELYVPAIAQKYDVFIPLLISVHEIEAMLIAAVTELSSGFFTASADSVLCDRHTGMMLDINLSAQELGLRNGSALMLI